MEHASSWLYAHEDEQARSREERLRSEMPSTALLRKVARLLGRQIADEQANKLGMWVHYAFGGSGGPAAKLLMRRGVPPLQAGVDVAAAMSVVVDEGLSMVLDPTNTAAQGLPWQAHARGFAAHAVYGVILGLMLSAGARDST